MVTGELQAGGGVTVRRIRSDDIELFRTVRLAALEESPDSFGETLDDARSSNWKARAAAGAELSDRAVFVALAADVPVGMVFVKCAQPPETAFLGGMWVRPDLRRRGVGRFLLQEALSFLRSAGQVELSLWVTRGHDDVLAFYRALGFRDTGATDALRAGTDLTIQELRVSLV